ncbi:MAG: hypothetical protein WBE44_00705 [Terriglobales bacterium]|jgi:hypothetical protein
MSQERRKRQQKREGRERPNPNRTRYIMIAIVIIIAFAAAYYFLWYKHTSRLDAFAKCLTAKQAKMYGAFWCPHCEEQKEKFGSSFQYAPYIECGIKGSKGIEPVCTQAGIKRFPTWIFADGTRVEGEHELDFLGQETGCSLP